MLGHGTIPSGPERQAEIDAVASPHRLPDFEDRPSLPYINASCQGIDALMRWHLALPPGLCASFSYRHYSDELCSFSSQWLLTMMSMMVVRSILHVLRTPRSTSLNGI